MFLESYRVKTDINEMSTGWQLMTSPFRTEIGYLNWRYCSNENKLNLNIIYMVCAVFTMDTKLIF